MNRIPPWAKGRVQGEYGISIIGKGFDSSRGRSELPPDQVQDLKRGICDIPPPPVVVMRVLEELDESTSSAMTVSNIVASDPSLTATILKAINSSFHGLPQEVRDVRQAVALLGFETVRIIVMQLGLAELVDEPALYTGYSSSDLWVHSLCVSFISQSLVSRGKCAEEGYVTTLGLLHDIGKLALNARFPDRMETMFGDELGQDQTFLEREEAVFGINHATIGGELAQRWRLPESLCEGIYFHHSWKSLPPGMPDEVRRAILVTVVANQLAKYFHAYCEDMEIDLIPDSILTEIGLPGSIDSLIDSRIKQCVTRAILFVDQLFDRPLRSFRRILRTRTADELRAAQYIPGVNGSMNGFIQVGGKVDLSSLLERESQTVDLRSGDTSQDHSLEDDDLLFLSDSSDQGLESMVHAMHDIFDRSGIRPELWMPLDYIGRLMMGNVYALREGDSEDVQFRLSLTDEWILFYVSSPALRFERVWSEFANADQSTRAAKCTGIIAATLGNILSLGWVNKIDAGADGSEILFRRKRIVLGR